MNNVVVTAPFTKTRIAVARSWGIEVVSSTGLSLVTLVTAKILAAQRPVPLFTKSPLPLDPSNIKLFELTTLTCQSPLAALLPGTPVTLSRSRISDCPLSATVLGTSLAARSQVFIHTDGVT